MWSSPDGYRRASLYHCAVFQSFPDMPVWNLPHSDSAALGTSAAVRVCFLRPHRYLGCNQGIFQHMHAKATQAHFYRSTPPPMLGILKHHGRVLL